MNPTKRSITWNEIERARLRLSRESGTILRDWGGKLPFALVYPNSYHVGMSNLGLQAIYGWLNTREKVLCERVFWDSQNLQAGPLPVSIESQRPLSDFAVLAFSLNYEIDYFNIAALLRASGLPLFSKDRDESHPLIIAGGPCIAANPLPVAAFFDCLGIGEAEALLPDMLPVLEQSLSGKRTDLLKTLSEVPGLYVPAYPPDSAVQRQWVKKLDDSPTHSIVLTPDTELKDLYLIEVERGCAHGCRFCLVSNTFSPVRFHSLEGILEQALAGLKYRQRIGLVGPAVTDHPRIEELFSNLLKMGAQFSISSLRMTSLTPRILGEMAKGGLRSIALAPEAGSECLRQRIKKGINEAQILEAVSAASQAGMQQIKLYFMVGLPQESEEDITAIADLVLAAKGSIDKQRSKTRLTLNISPFVPKANTPFQWLPMESVDILQQRIGLIKSRLAHQGVEVKNESPQWSEVQAVLSRGGAGLAEVLAGVSAESLPAWRKSVLDHQLDVDYYAHQRWRTDLKVPWHFIDSGQSPQRLENELEQSMA